MLLKLVNLSSSDSYTMVYTMDNIRSKVSSRNPKFKSELLFIITFAFTKYPFFAPEILLFQSFQFILIIPRTNNNIRQMFSEHFSSFFLPFFFFLPENQKKSSAKGETEQTEQTCNNTSFSPVWITIISCEIESLIARIRYDDDQLAPVRK